MTRQPPTRKQARTNAQTAMKLTATDNLAGAVLVESERRRQRPR